MATKEFPIIPEDVPAVKTEHRTICTALPAPASVPTLERLRAIEPRSGFWTLPAGYMELGETTEEGAKREAWEEARAKLELDGILAIYSIARIGQVQIIYRAHLAEPGIAAGPESLDVRFFAWEEIPWDDIAFPSVRWALRAWQAGGSAIAGNPPEDARGVAGL